MNQKIECTFNRSHIEFCTLLNMHMDMFSMRPACWKSIKHVCCHLKGLLDNLPHKHMQISMLVKIQRRSFVNLSWYKLISITLLNIHRLGKSEKKGEVTKKTTNERLALLICLMVLEWYAFMQRSSESSPRRFVLIWVRSIMHFTVEKLSLKVLKVNQSSQLLHSPIRA